MPKEDELYSETPSAFADDSPTLKPPAEPNDILAKASQEDLEEKSVKTGILVSSVGIGMFMGALDESIVNVSLPTISSYFGVDQVRVQWIILVYLLIIVGLTAAAGYLGDKFSSKLVFQIGMIIFAAGSILCVFSVSLEMLVIARAVQGIGATGTLANGNALITRFTTEEKRGLAIGLSALIAALGVVIGPILGGILTQYFGWQSIFWINIPVGVVGIIYVQFAIPKTKPLEDDSGHSDVLGSILFAIFMSVFILAITLFVDPVIPNPMIWGVVCFGISIILATGFVLWERRAKQPFIEFSLFRNKKFTIGVSCALITYIALNSVSFQLPFYMSDILLFNSTKIGLVIIGVPIGLAITAPLSGKISSKIDSRILSTIGLSAIGISLVLIVIFLSDSTPLYAFILIAFLIGLAIGLFTSPNSNSVLSSSPKEKLGVVSGLLSLSRNIGYSIGTAMSTTIFIFIKEQFQLKNGGLLNDPINYVPAMKILFGILLFFMVIAITLSALRGPEIRMNNDIDIISMPADEAYPFK